MSLFPEPNWSSLDSKLVQKSASARVYQKALALQDSVVIRRFTPQEIEFSVKDRFHTYMGDMEVTSQGELLARCTCVRARRGKLCEHETAALLKAQKIMTEQIAEASKPGIWRRRWESWLPRRRSGASKEIIPFYSLQLASSSYYYYNDTDRWQLKPYYLPVKNFYALGLSADDILDSAKIEEAIETYGLLANLKPISNRALLANLKPVRNIQSFMLLTDLEFAHTLPAYLRSYYEGGIVGMTLDILSQDADVMLYFGDASNPLHRRLRLLPQPLTPQLHFQPTLDNGLKISFVLPWQEEDSRHLEAKIQIISKIPPWLLYDQEVLFQLARGSSLEEFQSLLKVPSFSVLPADKEAFLTEVLPGLAQTYTITGIDIQWETCREATFTPRLYLSEEEGEEEGSLRAALRFAYGDYEVPYEKSLPESTVIRKEGTFTLVKIARQPEAEHEVFRSVSKFGLKRSDTWGIFELRKRVEPIDFLLRHVPRLTAAGFEIYGEESIKSVRVNRNRPTISFNISSGIDWFDVQALVKFGDIEASLKEIRRAVRRKERFIKLADGSMGEIPEEWIQRYRRLFALADTTTKDDELRFDAHHLTLLDQLLAESDQVQADEEFQKRLQRLRDFSGIAEKPLPSGFVGELRPYQVAGYNWLHFLHDYGFGGCLADDMGLGKTIQALAFFQSLHESGHAQKPSLIVVPRSLLINWEREANRFTPALRVLIHAGPGRTENSADFDNYDLVITTYGIVLRDLEILRPYRFHYVVLDESQAVKNPVAKTSRAVRMLQSDHRLALTGTPIENTTIELWSLFAFLNPGLLGNLDFFRGDFANPIERHKDEDAANILRRTVYPFILRRTKEQVAPELPPRNERILYCDMEPAQRKLYQRWRDYYRGVVLGLIEEEGGRNVHMKILEGLLRLRQIAILPQLVDEKFRGKSSKFEMLQDTIETLRQENHKALIFSQFVQVLTALRHSLDQQDIPYVYLDGHTRKRQERVDQFQNDPNIPFFLISLKAGGVGLNLTAADYVIHIDPWWNPAVEMQAADRAHRIGQDKPVFIYKLITRDTVEEKILKLQEQKRNLVEQVISTEGGFYKSLTTDDIQVLFS